jgi:xylosidase/arabinosidase
MYAPDVVQGNDGRYYLYYTMGGEEGNGGFDGPISVAVCDTPAGKYEYLGDVRYADGRQMNRFIPFDPAVINDGGRILLYYGWALTQKEPKSPLSKKKYQEMMQNMFHKSQEELFNEPQSVMGANVVELEDDMLTVKGEPVRMLPGENMAEGTEFEGHAFFEASSIRKIGELYYFIYSSSLNHELCYATSRYPDRDFHYGGVIVSNGDIGINGRKESERLAATGNNHGSIEKVNGEWYIFYHRQTHLNSFNRQGCAEKITISKDGEIAQVEMTSCGLNSGPLAGEGEYPAAIACILTDGHMPHLGNTIRQYRHPMITHSYNERYIANIRKNTLIGYKYFNMYGKTEVMVFTRGKGRGILYILTDDKQIVGEIQINPAKEWEGYSALIDLKGTHALYFEYEGRDTIEMLKIKFNPQKLSSQT